MSIALHVESQNWPSRFAQRGRLIQQVDIWRKDQWSTCKSFVFNIFGSRDLLGPISVFILGSLSSHQVSAQCEKLARVSCY